MSEVRPDQILSELKPSACEVLPKFVKISALEEEMVEGGGVTFECVVGGGHPRPEVVWLLNNNRYTTVEYVSQHCQMETNIQLLHQIADRNF